MTRDRIKNVSYLLFGIFAIFLTAIEATPNYTYTIQYYDVPIDHFSFANNITFKIRYLTNETFKHHSQSPIFFYTGNEGNIELFAKNTGFMWEIAKEFGASLVFAEHRYYGESMPFGNQSFDSSAHSGYLTSEQALADYADLLTNKVNTNGRPVIAFGGSYGGMLAAWLRMKYPHVVAGAIAASAPILQFTADCNRFNTILTSVFATTNRHCSENIRKSWKVLKDLAATPEGRNTLNAKFKFCKAFNSTTDYDDWVEYLTDVYGNLAMVNYPYETSFLAPLPPNPVTQFCSYLNQTFDDAKLVDPFQQALSVYTNYTGQTKCIDIKSAYDANMGAQGWDYQSCTEMVMPMCSKGSEDRNMFPIQDWDFQKFSDKCFKQFGIRPSKTMASTIYGGNKLQAASNIVFSNGLQDPWSGGGVLRPPNHDVIIILIPDAAHHLDLRSSNEKDSGSVRQARIMEKDAIRKWLRQVSATDD